MRRGGDAAASVIRSVRIHERDGDLRPVTSDEEELVPFRGFAIHDRARERREQVTLDGALERTRTQIRGEALLEQEVDRGAVPLHRPAARAQPAKLQGVVQLLPDQGTHRRPVERPEHDDAIDPVEQFGPERAPQPLVQVERPFPARDRERRTGREADARRHVLESRVRRHDHDRVSEVRGVAEPVREPAVVEHLEEQVPHAAVRLLELVEEDHRERLTPDPLHERDGLARDVSVADHAREIVLGLQLTHVEPDHPVR